MIEKTLPVVSLTSNSLKNRREKKFLENNGLIGDVLSLKNFINTLLESGSTLPTKITWKELEFYKENKKDFDISQVIKLFKENTPTLLTNTIYNLVSLFLQDEKSLKELQKNSSDNRILSLCFDMVSEFNFFERFKNALSQVKNYKIELEDSIFPKNSLEELFLQKIEQVSRTTKKRKTNSVKHLACLSRLSEANNVISIIDKFMSKSSIDLKDIVVTAPSKHYFEESLIPIFENLKIKYIVSGNSNSLSDTKLYRLFESLYYLIVDDFSTKSIIDVLFNLKEFNSDVFDKKSIKQIIAFTLKYNLSGFDYDKICCKKNDRDFEIDSKRAKLGGIILELSKYTNPLDISTQILNCILKLLGLEELEKNIIKPWKNFLKKLSTSLKLVENADIGLRVIKEVAKNTKVSGRSFLHSDGIVLATMDGIPNDAKLNIIMGVDQQNFDLNIPKHLIEKSKTTKKLYSFIESSLFKTINRVKNYLNSEMVILTYSKHQESSIVSHSYFFNDFFVKGNQLSETSNNYLITDLKTSSSKLVLNKEVSKELFNQTKNKKRLSASGINRLFQCNYYFYLLDGIGLNKYINLRLDNMRIGTWVHEILQHFFDENNQQYLINTNGDEYSKKFIELAKKSRVYIDLIKYRVCEEIFLDYFIYYLKTKITPFMFHLKNVYEKSNIKVKGREFKFGYKDNRIYLGNSKNNLLLTGTIDQVLEVNSSDKNYFLIVDFKSSSKSIGLSTFFLLKDVQIPLYTYALNKGQEERFQGGFYLNYFLKNVDENETTYVPKELQRIYKYTSNLSDYFVLNQNMTEREITKRDDNNLSFDEIDKLLEWMIEQIEDKFLEVTKGVIHNYPTDEAKCKFCRFQTFCGIKWEKNENKVLFGGTSSVKFLKNEIKSWEKMEKKKRSGYIKDFKEGM